MVGISAHDAIEECEKSQIRQFFHHLQGGICVEVGANEPVSVCSQSLHLEEKLKLLKRMYLSIWFKKIHYAWIHKTLRPFQTL